MASPFATPTPAPGASSPTDGSVFPPQPRRNGMDVPKSAGRGRIARSNSTSKVTSSHDTFHRRLDFPALAPHLQRRSVPSGRENGVTGMMEFLQNTEPPSSNFMSIPDPNDERGRDERGRGWTRWPSLGRSKSAPRNPPCIRLPDTAVSGTTIGGHRHIAITIPSQAFPMGELPRSQYPIYSLPTYSSSTGTTPIPSPNGFYQTIINDKGTVTVLRTIDEQARQQHHGRLAQSRNSRHSTFGHSTGLGASTDSLQRPRTSPQRFPARSSSRTKMMALQPFSIDSIIADHDEFPKALLHAMNTAGREATAELYANRPLPKIKSEAALSGPGSQRNSRDSGAASLPNNPLGPKPEAPAGASKVAESRRQKVRDRKQRDVEALLALRMKRARLAENQHHSSSPVDDKTGDTQEAGLPTLAPIQVVIDIEPSSSPVSDETHQPKKPLLGYENPPKSGRGAPDSLTPPNTPGQGTCAPEDAQSTTHTSQSQPLTTRKQMPMDRTALLRRREWNATRREERKGRERRSSVVAHAKRLAAEMGDDPTSMQAVDREILRLYEAFREHRFRDMEKRLRRLERNGDVWLRALVPVLQSLHTADGVPRPDSAPVPGKEEEEEDTSSLYGSVSDSEDLEGLDAIEPLIRELAGAAAARQMRSSRLLHAY